jgi:hypothetical protein
MFNGTSIKHVEHPKYLGVTLDRTQTFKSHLEKAAKKVSSRVNLVRKLADTKWGSNAQTLRTAFLVLVYSSAEYCAPVWLNSAHVHNSMAPCVEQYCIAKLRRKTTLFRELNKNWINGKSLMFEQLQDVPALRLRSRNPIWIDNHGLTNTVYDLLKRWSSSNR